jgi:transglutaminase-like putative cysteine protease
MKYKILHTTGYTYSESVFLEPHHFRFKPRTTPHSQIREFRIEISPEPAGFSEFVDPEDNHVMFCWFEGNHNALTISASTVIEVSEYNPFNFLVHPPEYLQVPFTYQQPDELLLTPSLRSLQLTTPIKDFIHAALKDTGDQSIPFLSGLTRLIHAEFTVESRETGPPLTPVQTFDLKKGSCRDLAWMQIHMLRHMGIAARFVSGYYYLPGEHTEFELHAWVEAYFPGAGWIGVDPGHGLNVGWNHIPVAASSFYEHTMPVTGSIRGSAASRLHKELQIIPVQSY